MLAAYHGLTAGPDDIRCRVALDARGASLAALRTAAEAVGLRTTAVRVGSGHLGGVTLPAVAHLSDGHYVVLYAIDAETTVIGDPAVGVRTVPLFHFLGVWSGHLLMVRPMAPAGGSGAGAVGPTRPSPADSLVSSETRLVRDAAERFELLARQMGARPDRRGQGPPDWLRENLRRLVGTDGPVDDGDRRSTPGRVAERVRRELLTVGWDSGGGDSGGDPDGASPGNGRRTGRPGDPGHSAALRRWSAFHECVGRLPPELREVVSLTVYLGWTAEQVARVVGSDVRSVRRLCRQGCSAADGANHGRVPSCDRS
jgi:hypothetical protein